MKMNLNEMKTLYTFGCPNREATVERLRYVAALTPDPAAKKLFYMLSVKLSDEKCDKWYRCFYYNLRLQMQEYYQHKAVITQVCSKLIYAEALNHPFDEPKQWEIREINEIMNNSIEGWKPFSNPRSFAKYGRQRGWERIPPPDNEPSATGSNLTDGFRELTEEEARQMELPF